MKSTEKLVDNLINDDFRKTKIDLQYATKHVMDRRVEQAKKEFIKNLNEK